MSDSLSKQIIYQRIRNRIIEVLELFADDGSFDFSISNLELWHDWVDLERIDQLAETVLTQDEVSVIYKVDSAWDCVEPNSLKHSAEWKALRSEAIDGLAVFMKRGKMSESKENVLH